MSRSVIRLTLPATALVAAAAALALAPSADAATPVARPTFGANAFGSQLHLGKLAGSGPSAHVALCTRKVGAMSADKTAALDVPGLGHIGAVTTHVGTYNPDDLLRSRADTHTASTDLFAGEFTFGSVSTYATATHHGATTTLGGSATFADLVIAGQAAPAKQPVNSTYALPGVGTVTLNAQQRTNKFGNPAIAVSAALVTVAADNTVGLPAGTVLIGRSMASSHAPTERDVTGSAYGSTVTLASGLAKSGRTAPVYLPCGGTAGQTATRNATAKVQLPSVLQTGDVDSHAMSTETGDATTVVTTNHIASATLLDGVVDAAGIDTEATAVRDDSGLSRSSDGTTIGSLTINGTAQSISGDPNQTIAVPGVGTLTVRKETDTANGLQVNALQLVLSSAQGGLPAGSVITIGGANAGVLPS